MKAEELAKKFAFFGAGIGVVLFFIFGIVPGAFVGGYIGLNITALFFGTPLESTLPVQVIVVAFLLWGVITSCCIFSMGSAMIWFFLGNLIGSSIKGNDGPQESD